MAATALFAAVATEAVAQDAAIVLNNQLQLGDVVAGQVLNVEDAEDHVTASVSAQGNSLSGAVQGQSIDLQSVQTMNGDATATLEMTLSGDTAGLLTATVQAGGNYLAGGAYDADMVVNANQTLDAGQVTAVSSLPGGSARLLDGADVGVSAIGNTVALAATGGRIDGRVDQASDAGIIAENFAATQYIPAVAEFRAQAIANAVAATTDEVADQDLSVRQRSTGDLIQAGTSANAGNAWDLAGRANATANQAVFANQGGALVNQTDQGNISSVRATAIVTAYDFGAATAQARGAANEVQVGNNDIYLEIDNTQVNSGGVEVSASFAGNGGFDAYVGADAVGNAITGYACADCEAYLQADNSQTNSGDVTANATTTISASGRAAITGANAVGNSASFYVTRP